jgi:4-amino-4-deoxy-L-arabinose transferase-like glycosyltransferase
MASVQDLVNKFETVWNGRGWRIGLGGLLVVILVVGYNWRSFHNLNNPEAMDAAQVGRNLAAGRGYTTQFIRPLSIYLIKQRNQTQSGKGAAEGAADPAQLKGKHPDLANPPVYPVVLAGLMKVLPFRYPVNVKDAFWSVPARQPTADTPRQFLRYQPDFIIALFNQGLLVAGVLLTFFLARRLFDNQVAWMAAVLMLGCELLWRFSVSGLPTLLLLLIFLALIWCLVWLESEEREPVWGHRAQFWLAGATGLLLGVGALTRYAFGWLLLPVLVYLGMVCVLRRFQLLLITLGVFLVVLSPWVARNLVVSRTPFGTASYALLETSFLFPENKLQRSLEPSFKAVGLKPFIFKLTGNAREMLQNDLPKLGGSWVSALFLTGLLLSYRSPALRRLRYFLLGTLLLFGVVQSLGRTQISEDVPVVNGENLLVLTVPLVFLFGTGLFFQLLDQMSIRLRELRYLIIGTFGFVACLPMVFIFFPPKSSPLAYPPYYPPAIQQTCGWMKEGELMMSDIPWALAWYGNRQCVWLTQNAQSEFFAIHDFLKPVRGLYLTPQTMDNRFLSQWVRAGEHSWPSFILESMLRNRIPETFPLRKAPTGFFPEQLFLSDYDRWPTTTDGKPAATGPIAPPAEEAGEKATPKDKDGEKK